MALPRKSARATGAFRSALRPLLLIASLLAIGAAARSFGICPLFTPIELTADAAGIAVIRVGPVDDKGLTKAEVTRILKGKAAKSLSIDLNQMPDAEGGKRLRQLFSDNGDAPALLFGGGGGDETRPEGLLHIGGKWVALQRGQDEDAWACSKIDDTMEETWAGGTDQLLRLTEFIIEHPEDARAPTCCDASLGEPDDLGRVPGKVAAAAAVDLSGKGRGRFSLFIASDAGDKVFAFSLRTGTFEDVTARLKLGSRSTAFAWGDFDGDGRLDLASSDGRALTLWLQAADRTFSSVAVTDPPAGPCLGLAALDAGTGTRSGLLWSAPSGPVLLAPEGEKNGAFKHRALAVAAGAQKERTDAGPCLVADFDNDLHADVLQPFAGGSVLYRGKGGGAFADGAACEVALGPGRPGAFLGDFDNDGCTDIFAGGNDRPRLWQNRGKGSFTEVLDRSGALIYMTGPGCIGGNTCDINNDGRQDVFLLYGPDAERAPQVFFNRGYRSLLPAYTVNPAENDQLPRAKQGQQAGVVADLDSDGRQDMAVVLADGSLFVMRQGPSESECGGPPLVAHVSLASGGAHAGPVTVSATFGRRRMGAWVVTPGSGPAHLACTEPGYLETAWQFPGGQPQTRTFEMEDWRQYFAIGAQPAKPSPEAEAARRKLIADLASADYATREAATSALIEMGEEARADVRAAAGSGDPEVKWRAEYILESTR